MFDLDMSPYGAYVWTCWGITAAVLLALCVRAYVSSRYWKRELARQEAVKSRSPETKA